MRLRSLAVSMLLGLAPAGALAVGPTVTFTLPAADTTPAVFGTLPFPNDLYFDLGQPGDGDGTLLNAGAPIGLDVDVFQENAASVEDALDLIDGFGTTTAVYFFLDGPIDPASLPASPVLSPALTDSVFCADGATAMPVPIEIRPDVDTRIANVLGVLPLSGVPLLAETTYTCVVRTSVTGGGEAVEPSGDWVSVRDGASANADADAIFDPVVATLGTAGVTAGDIAGMTVFTTETTTLDVLTIRSTVLPGEPVPTADLTSRPELVFDTPAELAALLGDTPHGDVAIVATGFFDAPQFQTADPNGDGPVADFPLPPTFVDCAGGLPCETTDEAFTRDGGGVPIVIRDRPIPFTVVIPTGTPPPGGWPIIIQQHGLGGQRDTVVAFGQEDAAAGFASIGIDAAQHGYRYFDCDASAPCSQDNANNVGGTAVPDGFVDGELLGFDFGFLTVNLGFFQVFHNFVGIRDNFRQTYVDLASLVRLLQGGSIDAALGTTLDPSQIFYMGHSLGALMGSGFVPIEPEIRAAVLNATGGGLSTQLFVNSSIGAGALSLVQGILGLDPLNDFGRFAIASNLVQTILDPGDALNSASLLAAPAMGAPRNVIQVEDIGDQVVPNPSNEALANAAGLPILQPYVVNLNQSPLARPLVPTPRTVSGNVAGATQALVQNGPATHAASLGTTPGTLTFVPGFARLDDFALTGDAFPLLERGIRVPNAGMLDELLAWFRDVITNGSPGTFTFLDDPSFNPIENRDVPTGASTQTFLARTVSAGSAVELPEPTPDVTVDLVTNDVATRLTVARTILGSDPGATDVDVPPGPESTVGTPGFLPFLVTAQRALPGLFTADVTVAYTEEELTIAGVPPGSLDESALVLATFTPGTCTMGGAPCSEDDECGVDGPCLGTGYAALPTTVDALGDTATATGVSAFSTFALVHPDAIAGGYLPPAVPGGGSMGRDCFATHAVLNPTNDPFLDRRGRVSRKQECVEGDAACDGDRTADGVCTFRIAVCLNQTVAALPNCTPSTVQSVQLRRPTPVDVDPVNAANAQNLVAGLVALGGTQGGGKQNEVSYAPAIGTDVCTALADVSVPTKGSRRGRRALRLVTRSGTGQRDLDTLRLRCEPAP